ncbi:MAG: AI-2E family transporter [Chitinivibrionia bacterium]|nr:AI-2E family transporter [Chitinivibrionia bacterium]
MSEIRQNEADKDNGNNCDCADKKVEASKGFWILRMLSDTKRYFGIFLLVVSIMLAYKLLFAFDELAQTIGRIVGILSPFILGFVIAYCINIPVSFLERIIKSVIKSRKLRYIEKFARVISILITGVGLIFLLVFGLRGFIPMIYENAMQLVKLMPGYIEQGLHLIKDIPYAEQLGINEMIAPLMETRPWTNFELNLGGGLRIAQNFFSGIFFVILSIISAIYFLAEYEKIKAFFHRVIKIIPSGEKQKATLKYVRLVDDSFRKFLTGQSLDSLILATITTTQFFFLGSPYPFVLGLMLGVANIVPYFGSIFGSMLAVFITFFSNGWETALLTAIILLITQQFDGYFINPRIMGTSFKLSPIIVIIAITVGGALGGVAGMIFAIPVVNVLKTVMDEFLETREKKLSLTIYD